MNRVGVARPLALGPMLCSASLCSVAFGAVVQAETLADAIAYAYQTNPTLQSQRAQLRGVDEGYVQARSAFGPTLQIQMSGTYTRQKLGSADQAAQLAANPAAPKFIDQNSGDAELVAEQNLYTGGKTQAEVNAAEARIRSGREALRAVEGNVILGVIQAYEDVLRDQQSLEVRRVSVQALQDQLVEIRARRKAGEVTLTDQAQAEAQLASEQALYASAQGQLQLSRSEYFSAVGQNPGSLAPAPDLPNLPATPDEAFDLAERTSPDLFAAQWTEAQSRDEIVAARAANRPTVSVRASFGYDGSLAPYVTRNDERTVTGEAVISQPLFTSGLNASLIRQAIEQNTSDRINIEAARRSMVQNVANAWNQRWTAKANVVAQVAQVKAAELAYRGMKVEYRAGERSTLDVLVAEETLRDAQLALIAAHHDVYLNTAAILRYVGRLEIRALMQGTPLYDPTQHFRTVANAGALPWEPLIQRIDALASPTANQHAIAAPATASEPRMAVEPGAIPSAAMATALPTVPIPGTVSATSLAKDWIAEGKEAPKH